MILVESSLTSTGKLTKFSVEEELLKVICSRYCQFPSHELAACAFCGKREERNKRKLAMTNSSKDCLALKQTLRARFTLSLSLSCVALGFG
ncbi:MAG: hypothetical protein M1505_00325 [Patescibacteria group bacterium]|nr:hypothetical protein [Patescibacteria group bacterium]